MMYAQQLFPSSLRHAGLLLILGALTVGLTGCYTQFQGVDKETRQDADKEKSFADAPLESLQAAELDTDQHRIRFATKLLKSRADTKISHSVYREGVHFFRKHHPEFYGNFFGDPFYATYDIRFSRLVRARQLVEIDVNPENSFWSRTNFFCAPYSYDPAFGGKCTGTRYTASEFFFVPSYLSPRFAPVFAASTTTRPFPSPDQHDVAQEVHRPPSGLQPTDDAPSSGDPGDSLHTAPRTGNRAPKIASGIQVPNHLPSQVRLPDDVDASIRETAASLRRTEVRLRLQRLIRQEYGGRDDLSPGERVELASRLSRTLYSSEKSAGTLSRGDRSSRSSDEYERLIDRIDRESTRRSTADRSTRSRSASSASRPDTGGDRVDSRNPGNNGSTAAPSERERSERSGSNSGRERSRSSNGGESGGR